MAHARLLASQFHELQGMELMRRGEVNSPLEFLRLATSINPELLQQEDKLGCIKPGAFADMLMRDFDPSKLSSFARAEQRTSIVMKNGKFIRNQLP